MSYELLAGTTSAAQSATITVTGIKKGVVPHVHLTAPGLAGSEVAKVQKERLDGSTYDDYFIDGVQQEMTATNTGVVIDAAGIYRVDKDATVASVPIEASTPDSP